MMHWVFCNGGDDRSCLLHAAGTNFCDTRKRACLGTWNLEVPGSPKTNY